MAVRQSRISQDDDPFLLEQEEGSSRSGSSKPRCVCGNYYVVDEYFCRKCGVERCEDDEAAAGPESSACKNGDDDENAADEGVCSRRLTKHRNTLFNETSRLTWEIQDLRHETAHLQDVKNELDEDLAELRAHVAERIAKLEAARASETGVQESAEQCMPVEPGFDIEPSKSTETELRSQVAQLEEDLISAEAEIRDAANTDLIDAQERLKAEVSDQRAALHDHELTLATERIMIHKQLTDLGEEIEAKESAGLFRDSELQDVEEAVKLDGAMVGGSSASSSKALITTSVERAVKDLASSTQGAGREFGADWEIACLKEQVALVERRELQAELEAAEHQLLRARVQDLIKVRNFH